MKNGIIWLASYPKSGNTWLRIFLFNYLENPDSPKDINQLRDIPMASSRLLFDTYTGIEASDLTLDEIDTYRPDVYIHYARSTETPAVGGKKFIKVHDAYHTLANHRPLFPVEATDRIIYIVRNPLDVAVSYAQHSLGEIDHTIQFMADDQFILGSAPHDPNLPHKIQSWSYHITSWNGVSSVPFLLLRYEDMVNDQSGSFASVIRFLDIEVESDRLQKAIQFSSFSTLQEQEKQGGFRERANSQATFFRKGKIGGWRNTLNRQQICRIVDDHSEVMQQLGYLGRDGTIRC